ncbi:MAG: hypothetical protein LBV30_09090 [Propionibacteriaceae bacterium]|jgi:multiple sugar transport system substrate-binding protein/putative aldouronate transport system substrate-binding protein|nr:hypothetical protein [Propionibacteriaceae bacterium]
MKLKNLAVLFTAGALAVSLAACSKNQPEGEGSSGSDGKYADPITIDVFDGLANFMGIKEGWFAKIVKDKFNMEMNIIAPNVAGQGDTLYNTRVAGGDLGDLVIMDKGQQLDELVEGGLLMDLSNDYADMTYANEFDAAVDKLNASYDGIYGLPTSVSHLKPTEPSEGEDPTFGPFLRWDYYAELGYPEIATLEDLLPILADMQAAHPTGDNGQPAYALSFFKDWDGNMMNNAKQPTCFYGYDELGFVLAKADGSDYQSIIDSDSEYVRTLKFFQKAQEMGLVDPESSTQNYDTLFTKYQNGQVLFSFWPWLGQSAYNTTEHLAQGKGFEIAPLEDMTVFSYGAEVYGGKQFIGIGSQAEDPERIADFIDWLYSPEGTNDSGSDTMSAPGPEGLTWEEGTDGPVLTDFGKKALLGSEAEVAAEWGGGIYEDGVSPLNVPVVLAIDENPETNYPYKYTFWPSYQAENTNPLLTDWQSQMGDVATTMDYLKAQDQLMVAPGASFVAPADSAEIETVRNQVKAQIVSYSWQMVFAPDQAGFDSLLTQMQSTVDGLGYQTVLEWDMANAKDQNAQRQAVAKEFG